MKKIESAILSKKHDGLMEQEIPGKGRGVRTTQVFEQGDFIVEYEGVLLTGDDEIEHAKLLYDSDPKKYGSFVYEFDYGKEKYAVDSTEKNDTLGRLINHACNGNCKPHVFGIDNKPFLIFLADRRIGEGEELLYDYGERCPETLRDMPWLKYRTEKCT